MSLLGEMFIALVIFVVLYVLGRIWGIIPSPSEIRARDQAERERDVNASSDGRNLSEDRSGGHRDPGIHRFLEGDDMNPDGPTPWAEYGLMLVLIVVVAFVVLTVFPNQVQDALGLFAKWSEGR